MRRKHFPQQGWLVVIGAAIAAGGVMLAIFHPRPIDAFLVPLPAIYAATLAGFTFWFRSQRADGRERTFWQLCAGGCWLWTLSGLLSFFILSSKEFSDVQFFRLALTFVPQILFMAAFVMQPEIREGQLRDRVVHYEAALVALWWAYLYALIVSPWNWLAPNHWNYLFYFARLHDLQNSTATVWLFVLFLISRGPWRRVYAYLTITVGLLGLSIGLFVWAWGTQRWLPTMIFEALLAAAFLGMSLSAQIPTTAPDHAPTRRLEPTLGAGAWLASITAIGIPALAIWASAFGSVPEPVRRFRLFLSFGAFVAAMLLLYRWQDVAEDERKRLVEDLGTTLRDLRELQGHFAEAEKLASLGQLAAGAAHEINNPVAAMLGYSELLRSEPSASDRVHEFGRKIGDQTRRIRSLMQNLLSLTEHEDRGTNLVDIVAPLRGALELRRISGIHREQEISLDVETEAGSKLEARADPEKLLQVFYRLLLAFSEGSRLKKIEVKAGRDKAGGQLRVEFIGRPATDPSPGATPEIYDAQRAQQGKELGLSVCYTIIKEHGGSIQHENLLDGGRLFRVELPPPHPAPNLAAAVSPRSLGRSPA